jgi:hypothetical protein
LFIKRGWFKTVNELKSVMQLAQEISDKVLEPTAAPARHIIESELHLA